MLQIYISTFFSIFTFVFISYLLGSFVLLKSTFDDYFKLGNVFLKFIIGLILIISTFSVYKTNGRTINVIFIFFFIICRAFFLFKNRNYNSNSCKILSKNNILDVLKITFFCSLWACYFIGIDWFSKSFWSNPLSYYCDYNFYTDIVQSMLNNNNENYYLYLNEFSNKFNGVTLYHFFHLWIAVCTKQFFALSTINSLMYVAYPLLFGATSYVLYLILIGFKQNKILSFLFSILILFFKGFIFLKIASPMPDLNQAATAHPKLIEYILAASISLFLLINEYKKYKWIPMFFLTMFSVVALPVVLLALSIETLFLILFKKWQLNKKENIVNWIILIGLTFGQFLIIKINPTHINYTSYHLKMNLELLITILKFMPLFIVEVLILLSFIILYFLGLKFSNSKFEFSILKNESCKFVLNISIAGFFCTSLACYDLNGWQMFFNVSLPLILISSILFIIKTFSKTITKSIILLTLLTTFILCALIIKNPSPFGSAFLFHSGKKYSKKYLKAMELRNISGLRGAFICDSTFYNGTYYYSPIIKRFSFPLSELHNSPMFISLNYYNVHREDKYLRDMYRSLSYFIDFVEDQKRAKLFVGYEKSQLDFVEKYKISFIVISDKVKLPSIFNSKVLEVITDEVSHETLYILK